MSHRVELLAPAGNIKCFYAAVAAGADAVYLAGAKFGARAYADNFTTEEIIEAIEYAHLFGVKVYLTLNTLIKEKEFAEIVPYVIPFYEAGLDGVIVQDFGVLELLKMHFPEMELHASTQMTVTGKEGAKLLQSYGVQRIVPARELSLKELREIKEATGIDMEIFIHGAMCYSYSGQCLFSSVLGGRSGNRGRCAGPCRLPYQSFLNDKKLNSKKQDYPLSCKDLCSIELLPQLIMSGMDSFKIEGRMKSEEYVAGVTAIYRKYIDRIYAYQNPDGTFSDRLLKEYRVADKDLQLLKSLYVRTNLQDGYFFRHNGAELLTLQKPCYETGDEQIMSEIRDNYIANKKKLPINVYAELTEGKEAILKVCLSEDIITQKEHILIEVNGGVVQSALNRPMQETDIKKQLAKTGNTPFEISHMEISISGNLFIPNKELNELRRTALERLEEAILIPYRRELVQTNTDEAGVVTEIKRTTIKNNSIHSVTVSVNTKEQLDVCLKNGTIPRIFISADLFWNALTTKKEKEFVSILESLSKQGTEVFVLLPRVMRAKASEWIKEVLKWCSDLQLDGVVTNSLEGLALAKQYSLKIVSDAGLYCMNKAGVSWLFRQGVLAFTLPYEMSYKDVLHFLKQPFQKEAEFIMPIYGYLPLMETAGCVAKTFGQCKGKDMRLQLTDRYHKTFTVQTHCNRCENTIYNAVVMSLFAEWEKLRTLPVSYRIDFTIESAKETERILKGFRQLTKESLSADFLTGDYTKGYFKRGVE